MFWRVKSKTENINFCVGWRLQHISGLQPAGEEREKSVQLLYKLYTCCTTQILQSKNIDLENSLSES